MIPHCCGGLDDIVIHGPWVVVMLTSFAAFLRRKFRGKGSCAHGHE
jgi:hypothetical protein